MFNQAKLGILSGGKSESDPALKSKPRSLLTAACAFSRWPASVRQQDLLRWTERTMGVRPVDFCVQCRQSSRVSRIFADFLDEHRLTYFFFLIYRFQSVSQSGQVLDLFDKASMAGKPIGLWNYRKTDCSNQGWLLQKL